MPATVFVAPGLLGRDTWWDHLGAANGGVIPEDARRYAIDDLRGDRDTVLSMVRVARAEEHAAGCVAANRN